MRSRGRGRGAFTLIELLVVIAIMAALFARTALAVSALAPSFKSTTGGDKAALWCFSARQMARRDGVPTGVRFNLGANNLVTDAQYVRQPDDVAQGVYCGLYQGNPANAYIKGVPTTVSLAPPVVSPGDYLEVYGGGAVRQITGVSAGPNAGEWIVSVNQTATGGVALPDVSANPPTPGVSPTNYRIIRQPQPIDGEATLKMPENTAIDFSAPGWNNGKRISTPPAAPGVTNDAAGPWDVIFSPSGQVIGQGTKSGMVYLWVRRAAINNNKVDPDNSGDPMIGKPVIVTIYVRTGAVAQHPANNSLDPYLFTRDGKSSGM